MDAVSLLIKDHRKVISLYDQYKSSRTLDEKRRIMADMIKEIAVHSSAEEVVIYPEVRKVLPDGKEQIDKSLHEHSQVKIWLSELDGMLDKADTTEFQNKLQNLISNFLDHVKEEEGDLLPRFKAAVGQKRIEELGQQILDKKPMLPTRPHPSAPDTYPANLANTLVTPIDKARDMARESTLPKTSH